MTTKVLAVVLADPADDHRKGISHMIEIGIRGKMETVVTEDKTARAMGSGELDVFATPAMIALIEETAWRSVSPYLSEGEGTVGTRLDVDHISATPQGMTVTCETELTEADRRRLVFRVDVFDGCGKIGEGTHERFIVDNERFMSKALDKGRPASAPD